MTNTQTNQDDFDADAAEEDEYFYCDLCDPADGSEPYPYPHCCQCGADGSSQFPDCTCE
ncbi:hypothetical protein ACFXPY_45595 [Streptomyces sp. NPDC059153]|uniref:hypothetical protein n=1 Tax=Streptomyces sp. NPDC059153 TaxID=3346743 RepID=UPI00367A5F7E